MYYLYKIKCLKLDYYTFISVHLSMSFTKRRKQKQNESID